MPKKKKETKVLQGEGCDSSVFGGGGGNNKQSRPIDVKLLGGVLSHVVKDAKGKLLKTRDFTIGQCARIVRGIGSAEIDESTIEDLDALPYGEILGFWTCLDGRDAFASGAEIKRAAGRVRLPLRMLLPMAKPKSS